MSRNSKLRRANVPTTELRSGQVLDTHGGLFRLLGRNVSRAHDPDRFGEVVWFDTEYLGPAYGTEEPTIPAHWRTAEQPWRVQGNRLATWHVVEPLLSAPLV